MTAGLLNLGNPLVDAAQARYQQLKKSGMNDQQIFALMDQEKTMVPMGQLAAKVMALKNAAQNQAKPPPQGTINDQVDQRLSAGLGSVPVNNVGNESAYASGGIVAFDEGGNIQSQYLTEQEQQMLANNAMQQAQARQQQAQQSFNQLIDPTQGTYAAAHGGPVRHYDGGGDVFGYDQNGMDPVFMMKNYPDQFQKTMAELGRDYPAKVTRPFPGNVTPERAPVNSPFSPDKVGPSVNLQGNPNVAPASAAPTSKYAGYEDPNNPGFDLSGEPILGYDTSALKAKIKSLSKDYSDEAMSQRSVLQDRLDKIQATGKYAPTQVAAQPAAQAPAQPTPVGIATPSGNAVPPAAIKNPAPPMGQGLGALVQPKLSYPANPPANPKSKSFEDEFDAIQKMKDKYGLNNAANAYLSKLDAQEANIKDNYDYDKKMALANFGFNIAMHGRPAEGGLLGGIAAGGAGYAQQMMGLRAAQAQAQQNINASRFQAAKAIENEDMSSLRDAVYLNRDASKFDAQNAHNQALISIEMMKVRQEASRLGISQQEATARINDSAQWHDFLKNYYSGNLQNKNIKEFYSQYGSLLQQYSAEKDTRKRAQIASQITPAAQEMGIDLTPYGIGPVNRGTLQLEGAPGLPVYSGNQ